LLARKEITALFVFSINLSAPKSILVGLTGIRNAIGRSEIQQENQFAGSQREPLFDRRQIGTINK